MRLITAVVVALLTLSNLAQAQTQRLSLLVSSQTCASNGSGTAAALTVSTAGTSYVALTQSDPDGCALTLGETAPRDGQVLVVVNISANSATISDSSGVQELTDGTAITLAQYAAAVFIYRSDRWTQATPGGAGGGGAPTTAPYITQTCDAGLSAEQCLSALATGYMKSTITSGVITTQATPIPAADGGTGLTLGTDDQVQVSNGTVNQHKTIPDCDAATTSKLLYDQATNVWTCGTDQDNGAAASFNQTIQDEAVDLTQRPKVNLTGAGVSCVDNAGATRTDCTIDGGGGSGDSTTTDTEANQPATTNDGNLFFPSNGFYVWRDNGATLAPWGPIYPMTAPVSGDFAWINQGAATITTTNGGVYLFGPKGASHNWRIRKKSAPSTPYTITVGFLPALLQVTSQRAGPLFRQSSDGKFVVFQVFKTAAGGTMISVEKWDSPTAFSASYTTIGFGAFDGSVVWLRIADDGTNRICSYSRDGQNFIVFHTVGRTDFLTADEVGFTVDDESNLYDVGMTLLSWKQG